MIDDGTLVVVRARSASSILAIVPEATMAHLLDPKRIDNETKYNAALEELDALMEGESDASVERRIDELFELIEEYQLRKLNARVVNSLT